MPPFTMKEGIVRMKGKKRKGKIENKKNGGVAGTSLVTGGVYAFEATRHGGGEDQLDR